MAKYQTYTVKAGDCLSVIAERELGSGSLWRQIQKLNNLTDDRIYAGQVLRIRELPEEKPVDVKTALVTCLSAIEKLPEYQALVKLL